MRPAVFSSTGMPPSCLPLVFRRLHDARFVRRHYSNGEHVIFAGTDGQVGGKYWFGSATILHFAGKRFSFARKQQSLKIKKRE